MSKLEQLTPNAAVATFCRIALSQSSASSGLGFVSVAGSNIIVPADDLRTAAPPQLARSCLERDGGAVRTALALTY
jgi:hypothetical protein